MQEIGTLVGSITIIVGAGNGQLTSKRVRVATFYYNYYEEALEKARQVRGHNPGVDITWEWQPQHRPVTL